MYDPKYSLRHRDVGDFETSNLNLFSRSTHNRPEQNRSYGNREGHSCPYCGDSFLTSSGLTTHVNYHTENDFGLKARQINPKIDAYYCSDCHQYFPVFELYSRHLEITGHQNHRMDKKVLSPPVRSPTATLSNEQKALRTRDERLPNQLSNYAKGTLFFGGVVRPDSLIGGAAWWIVDDNKRIVTYGSIYVHQTFPSLIRLEYEALLNGLRAVCLNNIGRVNICGSSVIVIAQLANDINQSLPYLNTVYAQTKDLNASISIVLQKFQSYTAELISLHANYYAHKLADKAIVKYEKRKATTMEKLFSQQICQFPSDQSLTSSGSQDLKTRMDSFDFIKSFDSWDSGNRF